LSGEKVTADYETFSVKGFRLDVPISEMPPILVAGLRGGMLRLAGREGDGAITNWLSPDDVPKIVEQVGSDKEIVARIIVLPTTDFDTVRTIGRRTVAAYLTVPAYAAFQEWLGRGDALREMNEAWNAGDRARALELVPDTLLDELIVHGTPAECVRRAINSTRCCARSRRRRPDRLRRVNGRRGSCAAARAGTR
jgi:alkanesulfonate monooxygenase SsuD/methylene tetrahydromethanopterin reductase-like flavin-dependent oxidoreductase (luciferase family)